MKLGTETGSFFNHLMSGDTNKPSVERGATVLLWSDRHAYFVNAVTKDGKECVIERAKAVRSDENGMSDSQNYQYFREVYAEPIHLKFRYGKWRRYYTNAYTGKMESQTMNITFNGMYEYYDYSF